MADLSKQFDWIFLDVGGPLVDDSAAVLRRREIDLKVLQQYRSDLTMADVVAAWPQACKKLGSVDFNLAELFLKPEEMEGARSAIKNAKSEGMDYLQLLKVRPEASAVCKQLANKYKLGLIANQSSKIKEQLLASNVLQHFTHKKVSEDYGMDKPDPRLYEAILRETGADPLRSIMIDDNIERSLMPAKKFGMTTVWYKLDAREVPHGTYDHLISSLNDLITLFL